MVGKPVKASSVLSNGVDSLLERLAEERARVERSNGKEKPSDVGREVARYAAVLRSYLPLNEAKSRAWAVMLLKPQPAVARSEPHETYLDERGESRPLCLWAWAPRYTKAEVELVLIDYQLQLDEGQWPVVKHVLAELARRRREEVRKADQDFGRKALPRKTGMTDEEFDAQRAKAKAWKTVTTDILDRLITADEAEAEAKRRETMTRDEIESRRVVLRRRRAHRRLPNGQFTK